MAKRTAQAPAPLAGALDFSSLDMEGFRAALLGWFAAHARDLPWRRTLDPYQVWISEIMLQQTQMDRAVAFFERFVARFPDAPALAAASEDEVLKLWEGLGYYSRARNLRKAARVLVERHGGAFPRDHAAVRALPGVGPYTAGAIMSVAYGEARPAVDANVERVLSRVLDIAEPLSSPAVKRRILAAAWELTPPLEQGGGRAFNQALMELGALVCGPRRADCPACPVAAHCLALARGTVADRPAPKPKIELIRIHMATGVLLHQGRVFVQKRRPGDVWPGLWEFPGGCLEEGEAPEQALVREFREETELAVQPVGRIAVVRYGYTRYRVTMHGFFCRLAPGQDPEAFCLHEATEGRFARLADLAGLAFPSGHARLLALTRADLRLPQLLGA